jgi:hypothetical protein
VIVNLVGIEKDRWPEFLFGGRFQLSHMLLLLSQD